MIEIVLLTLIRSFIVVIAVAIGVRSYQVATLHPDNKLTYLLLASGFLVIGMGVAIEGALYQFYHIELIIVHSIEALIASFGLMLILVAIYKNRS